MNRSGHSIQPDAFPIPTTSEADRTKVTATVHRVAAEQTWSDTELADVLACLGVAS